MSYSAATLSGQTVRGDNLRQLRRGAAWALSRAHAEGRDMIGGVGRFGPEHILVLCGLSRVTDDDALRLSVEQRRNLTICAAGQPRYHKFSAQAMVNYLQLPVRTFAEELQALGLHEVRDAHGEDIVGRLRRGRLLPLIDAFWRHGGTAALESAQRTKFLLLQRALVYGLHKFRQERAQERVASGWRLHKHRPDDFLLQNFSRALQNPSGGLEQLQVHFSATGSTAALGLIVFSSTGAVTMEINFCVATPGDWVRQVTLRQVPQPSEESLSDYAYTEDLNCMPDLHAENQTNGLRWRPAQQDTKRSARWRVTSGSQWAARSLAPIERSLAPLAELRRADSGDEADTEGAAAHD